MMMPFYNGYMCTHVECTGELKMIWLSIKFDI